MEHCAKCGNEKDLRHCDDVSGKISQNSNPNVMKFKDCYLCDRCIE